MKQGTLCGMGRRCAVRTSGTITSSRRPDEVCARRPAPEDESRTGGVLEFGETWECRPESRCWPAPVLRQCGFSPGLWVLDDAILAPERVAEPYGGTKCERNQQHPTRRTFLTGSFGALNACLHVHPMTGQGIHWRDCLLIRGFSAPVDRCFGGSPTRGLLGVCGADEGCKSMRQGEKHNLGSTLDRCRAQDWVLAFSSKLASNCPAMRCTADKSPLRFPS